MKIQSYRFLRFLNNFLIYFLLSAFALVMIFPFLYMLATMAYGYTRVQTFQIPIAFWGIIFIASMMQFVSVIPFQVFGGLGVTEVSLVYLYSLFGLVDEIPAILVGLRVLFYIFNLILLAYVPLDSFLSRKPVAVNE